MAAYEGEYLSNIWVYDFTHITNKGGICVIKVCFSHARIGFMDQSCSETL